MKPSFTYVHLGVMIIVDVGAYLCPYHKDATVFGIKIGICPHKAGPIRQIPAAGVMEEMDSCIESWVQPRCNRVSRGRSTRTV